jgi:hypothetical protein
MLHPTNNIGPQKPKPILHQKKKKKKKKEKEKPLIHQILSSITYI